MRYLIVDWIEGFRSLKSQDGESSNASQGHSKALFNHPDSSKLVNNVRKAKQIKNKSNTKEIKHFA